MNETKITEQAQAATSKVSAAAQSAYARFASGDSYQKVTTRLRLIDFATATLAAISTAYVNGFSHLDNIGLVGAFVFAGLTFVIVEFSVFTLDLGLRETFKGGSQRLLAWATYYSLRGTMLLNAGVLAAAIAGLTVPPALDWWGHWAFVVHMLVGLMLIPAIRHLDPVVAHRMLTLKAESAVEDLIILRRAAAVGGVIASGAARLRGWLDQLSVGWHLVSSGDGFGKRFVSELNRRSAAQFSWLPGAKKPDWIPDDLGNDDPKSKRRQ